MSLNSNACLYGKKSLRSADSGDGPRGAPYVDSGTGGSCPGWARSLLALGAAQGEHVEWLRGRPGLATGPKWGELFGYHTVPRYLDNTTFTQLVRGHLRLQDRSTRVGDRLPPPLGVRQPTGPRRRGPHPPALTR
ncbi:hypothetical protein [Streptomyces sp. NPDC006333]|uniref:hypothetical protein n=1 Tax=Streptomyces sp. NPDC006333 TaxID=3156753 RepID=UPI00339E5D36